MRVEQRRGPIRIRGQRRGHRRVGLGWANRRGRHRIRRIRGDRRFGHGRQRLNRRDAGRWHVGAGGSVSTGGTIGHRGQWHRRLGRRRRHGPRRRKRRWLDGRSGGHWDGRSGRNLHRRASGRGGRRQYRRALRGRGDPAQSDSSASHKMAKCTPMCAKPLTVGANCCSGGRPRSTWIVSENGAHPAGWMQFNAISAPADASYDVTFWYHCGDSRHLRRRQLRRSSHDRAETDRLPAPRLHRQRHSVARRLPLPVLPRLVGDPVRGNGQSAADRGDEHDQGRGATAARRRRRRRHRNSPAWQRARPADRPKHQGSAGPGYDLDGPNHWFDEPASICRA